MKVLFLYARLRSGGGEYHRSKSFTTMLEDRHRVEYRYAVFDQDHYDRFSRSDAAFPEIMGTRGFVDGSFDAVFIDGRVFENPHLPRVPLDCLKEFHGKGGIVVFLSDLDDVTAIRTRQLSMTALGEYLGAVLHGDGGPFEESPGVFVKGVRHGDSSIVRRQLFLPDRQK